MPLRRREFLRLAALAGASCALAHPGIAQAWPARPLRLIVPFSAGGTTDLIGRIMAQWLSQRLGQQVVVENKPGGGANIGVAAVVAAPPDGYTLLFTVATNAINEAIYKSLPFDFVRDIAPVAGLAELPLVMEVNPALPAKTVKEFIAYAKANPRTINMASFGTRTISHLAIELFKMSTGIDVVHVPYPGGAPLMTDLLSGRIQAGVDALPNSLPHIRSGGTRALAMLSAARSQALPDLPTMGETIAGYEVRTWSGIGVPAGTPAEVIARLNREINAGLMDPGIAARFAEVGAMPTPFTVDEMRAMIARDVAKWAHVIEIAGIKPQ